MVLLYIYIYGYELRQNSIDLFNSFLVFILDWFKTVAKVAVQKKQFIKLA